MLSMDCEYAKWFIYARFMQVRPLMNYARAMVWQLVVFFDNYLSFFNHLLFSVIRGTVWSQLQFITTERASSCSGDGSSTIKVSKSIEK